MHVRPPGPHAVGLRWIRLLCFGVAERLGRGTEDNDLRSSDDPMIVDRFSESNDRIPHLQGSSFAHESITERWCSDDLSAIVLTVFEDTKTGVKTSIAMQNIERAEPDPTLFQIPPNYAVTESIEETHGHHNPHSN
jgi:hypothetical protein